MTESTRESRAAARRERCTETLGTEHDPMPLGAGSAADRFRAVVALSLAAWAFSGAPLPSYNRATMPGRMLRTWDR